MSNFLFHDDEESYDTVDIDSLFEKKQQKDLKQLSIFNKILNRIHKRINYTAKTKPNDKHLFFTVPEYIFEKKKSDPFLIVGVGILTPYVS